MNIRVIGNLSLEEMKEGDTHADRNFLTKHFIILYTFRKEAHMKNKKGLGKVLFFLLLAGFLVTPCGTAFSQPSYKVGYLNSHSGFMAFMGTAVRDGFLLGVDEINAAGGINGRKLDVVIYDDESDVAKGVLAFKKLINTDKVLMTSAINHSGVAMACAPIAEQSKVPYLGIASSRWIVAKPGKWQLPADPAEVFDYVVKFRVDSQIRLEKMYNFFKKLGVRKFAWISPGTGFGRSAKEIMEATYKSAGIELSAAEEYGPNDSVMTSQLTKIKASDFDAIILYAAEPAGALVYKQAREMGITKPIIADSALIATSILKTLGQYLVGLYVCAQVPDLPDLNILPKKLQPMAPVVRKVRKGIMEKYNRPADWMNAQGYDVAMVMADILRRAAPDPTKLEDARAKIRQALVSVKGFVGADAMGDITATHELEVPTVLIKLGEGLKFEVAE
jgi:branched-chain amino acid transport system substrate-binding protein